MYLHDGQSVPLDLDTVRWAQRYKDESHRGGPPKRVDDVLKPGDVVRLARNRGRQSGNCRKLPGVQGALIALDPEDGAIKAEVGGFSYARSKFNRAIQSSRQPGSSFKPFFYSAAFEHGFTPASIINDAPIVFADPSKPNGLWTPQNDDGKFDGPMRLREAMVQSKNLVSVRLLDAIGVHYAREYVEPFRFSAGSDTREPVDGAGYGIGVADHDGARLCSVRKRRFSGQSIFPRSDQTTATASRSTRLSLSSPAAIAHNACSKMRSSQAAQARNDAGEPVKTALSPIASAQAAAAPVQTSADPNAPKLAPRVLDARIVYLIGSLLHDVVRRGTGHDAMVLKRNDLAGKTGSTNDHRDAWFSGYNDALVASVWVGFDDFSSLGRSNGVGEFGAQAALPMWIQYMRETLKGVPEKPFEMPAGITTARIDPATGQLAPSGDAAEHARSVQGRRRRASGQRAEQSDRTGKESAAGRLRHFLMHARTSAHHTDAH